MTSTSTPPTTIAIVNPNGYWISKEKVEVESVLKSGRMMVVSKAYLTDGNKRNAVAVKALKSNLTILCHTIYNYTMPYYLLIIIILCHTIYIIIFIIILCHTIFIFIKL